jgi:uncharacterized protein YggT (Ycf19 family)
MQIIQLATHILSWLGYIIFGVSAVIAALLILRVIVSYVSSNPFSWLQYNLRRVTEPLVIPFRGQFPARYMRFDLMPLVMAVIVLLAGLFIADMIWQLARIMYDVASTLVLGSAPLGFFLGEAILLLGWLYIVAFLLRFLLPWLGYGYRNSVLRFCFQITEPLLKPLRRVFVAGVVDFSWMIAILLVQIVTRFLASIVS